jgi:hypothetical protein
MIEFDESTHTYTVDGVVYPSVTQVLHDMGLSTYYDSGDDFYKERGQAVHKCCELIDSDTLDWSSVDPRITGYLDAYLAFKEETRWQFDHSEERLADDTYKFCGSPDRFWPLLDLKTTASRFDLQLSAYAILLQANGFKPGREAYFLQLKPDGKYTLNTYVLNRRDTGIWHCAVSLWWYRKEKGLL